MQLEIRRYAAGLLIWCSKHSLKRWIKQWRPWRWFPWFSFLLLSLWECMEPTSSSFLNLNGSTGMCSCGDYALVWLWWNCLCSRDWGGYDVNTRKCHCLLYHSTIPAKKYRKGIVNISLKVHWTKVRLKLYHL